MSWTDQKPRIATEEHLKLPWNGNRRNFRCYLCGHKFKVGDYWRFVFCPRGGSNFLTCEKCDGSNVLERWQAQNVEAKERFWHFTQNEEI